MQEPYIGAYWSARKENLEQCTDRCLAFMLALSAAPNLSTWFKKGVSRKAAKRNPIRIVREEIRDNFRTNNSEIDGTPIADLGYRFTAWNGNLSTPADVSITCGAYSKFVSNAVVLQLPSLAEVDPQALKLMRELLQSTVDAWDPDHAIAISSALLTQQGGKVATATGWYNYRRGEGITSP